MPETYAKSEQFLAAALHGKTPAWPETADAALMLKLGEHHGVNALVDAAHRGVDVNWPEQYTRGLADQARQQTGHQMLRHRELLRVLEAFATTGIKPLIMKGAALAYSHYHTPVLRPRCDIDLLVADADRDACDKLLLALGYERGLTIPGHLVSHEQCYFREQAGFQHLVDLHWKINNRNALACTFSYHDLLSDAITIPALGEFAWTLNPVHAVLLACMHRVASLCTPFPQHGPEKFNDDRLIWLYDIHLLCSDLEESEWQRVRALSREHKITAIVKDGLRRCWSVFGTALRTGTRASGADVHELSAGLLNATPRQAFLNDLQCLSWADRLRLVTQVLLPPRTYMRRRYGNDRPLALQYLARVAGGVLRRR